MKVSVDHWRARLRARAPSGACAQGVACQSIIGALACAPNFMRSRSRSTGRVSRSLARSPARRHCRDSRTETQRIIGALACAPSAGNAAVATGCGVSRSLARSPARLMLEFDKGEPFASVSRSLARSPARPQRTIKAALKSIVSVDHWRARLRAKGLRDQGTVAVDVSVDHWRARLRAVLFMRIAREGCVSVDHWRARLRAIFQLFHSPNKDCVSRSLARSPARLRTGVKQAAIASVSVDHWRARLRAPDVVIRSATSTLCQSIIGALACAPATIANTLLGLIRVSRSLARSPARPPSLSSGQCSLLVSVDHWRARLRAG